MAKVNARQANETFKPMEGATEFFSIKNDMESVPVRFLYDNENDLDTYIVHQVEINGKKRYVDCIQEDCPLCKSGNRPKLKLFLQLIDSRDNKVKLWERGQKFIPMILGIFNKYGAICNREYEIERHGVKGDTSTTYSLYALDKDNKTMKDLPERQNLENGYIIEMTKSEMEKFIETGAYSKGHKSSEQQEEPRRRERVIDDEDIF